MLSDTRIRAAKPADKPIRLRDERGLYLEVTPSGGRWWRLKYRFAGREKMLSMGTYPDTTLKLARDKRDRARELLAEGVDPSEVRRAEKATRAAPVLNGFEAVAREWHSTVHLAKVSPGHGARTLIRLEQDVFPWLGGVPIGEVKAPQLLRAIEAYKGMPITRAALQLAPLVFVRPGELRKAEWLEFDLDARQWRIPASRMKRTKQEKLSGGDHVVPLSRQAMVVLRELHPLTGHGRYLFPSPRTGERPMSDNGVLAALRRMGFPKDEMTGHGFRAMARTLLAERLNVDEAVIEAQLAHAVKDSLGRAYNRTAFLQQRRKMVQLWADYLDKLGGGHSDQATAGPGCDAGVRGPAPCRRRCFRRDARDARVVVVVSSQVHRHVVLKTGPGEHSVGTGASPSDIRLGCLGSRLLRPPSAASPRRIGPPASYGF